MSESRICNGVGVDNYELLEQDDSLEIFRKWKKAFCPSLNIKSRSGYAWEEIVGVASLDEALRL